MAGEARARPVGRFATGLGLAVLLAACLAAALVAVLADRLSTSAVQRETVAGVASAASAAGAELSRPDPGATSAPSGAGSPSVPASAASANPAGPDDDARLRLRLAGAVDTLAAEPEVLGLLVVDARGTALLDLPGRTHPGGSAPEASTARRRALADTARSGSTLVGSRPGADGLTVTVPLRLPDRMAVLQVTLDDAAASRRAGQLWRALGVALVLGAGCTGALVFVTGGRRLIRRHERALLAAATDDLTGLGSRRAFRRELRVQVEHARRHGLPLTLALLDVNGLETVNGTVGRRRGDALLLAVGAVLLRTDGPDGLRPAAYRIGGDAFALVMPGMRQEQAFALTDALRRRIALDAAPLTANVGLGVLDPLRCPDPETLLIAADAALFEARCLGGNRVVGGAGDGTGLRWVATSGAHDGLS